MLLNKGNLTAVFINLKTTFNKAFDSAPTQWAMTAMMVPSGSSQNDYSWLSRFPRMKKWLGDKTLRKLSAHKYTVVNDDWEATVEVDRNDIEDDNIGIYAPMAQEAGYASRQLPDEIVADLKNNAFTEICYDGQYFYDTSYGAARTAIMSLTDDDGRPLGLIPNILEVPPALEATAKIIAYNDKLIDESPNPYKGTCEVVVNPWLTDPAVSFLHVANRPLKPFIYQQRKAPVFVQATDPGSDDVFMRKTFKYGAEARAAGGYGLWQLSHAMKA